MSGALGSAYDMGWGHPYPALPYKDSVEVGKILHLIDDSARKSPEVVGAFTDLGRVISYRSTQHKYV